MFWLRPTDFYLRERAFYAGLAHLQEQFAVEYPGAVINKRLRNLGHKAEDHRGITELPIGPCRL